MRQPLTLFFLLCLALCESCATYNGTPLFTENGEDWSILGDATWNFQSGMLIGDIKSGSGFVITKETYEDFELILEFKPDSTINSGIFVRCLAAEISNSDCYEFNIWDEHPNQEYRTGSVVRRSPPLTDVNTIDKWNTYRVLIQGEKIKAWVNESLTINMVNYERPSGYIGLQAAGEGEIRFRNIRIKRLSEE